jgi:hypothetical protein
MNQKLNKVSNDKEKRKNSLNPIVKIISDNKTVIAAIRDEKNLSALKDITLTNPIYKKGVTKW